MSQLFDIGKVGIPYQASRNKENDNVTGSVVITRLHSKSESLKMHEQNHRAIGGAYAGDIHYRYMNGPDGKRYIIGGAVSIKVPRGGTPEEEIRALEQIKRAALAPTAPSYQDLAVVAKAELKEIQARQEIRQKLEEYRKSYSNTAETTYKLPDLTRLFNLVA